MVCMSSSKELQAMRKASLQVQQQAFNMTKRQVRSICHS